MERRRYKREKVNHKALLLLQDRNINCDVENISCAGAYVKIFDESMNVISASDIGEDVIFSFDVESDNSRIRGKILRYDRESEGIYVAVYFLEACNFD